MLSLLVLLLGCATSSIIVTPVCQLAAPTVEPTTAAPGEVVTLTSSALTEAYDTAVLVGSTRGEVVGVDREGCSDCDSCVTDTGNPSCSVCALGCNDCAELCTSCMETVRVRIPDLPDGSYTITVSNARGTTPAAMITVSAKK